MLRSMTGYGRGVALGPGFRIEVELQSVNRRQFDLQLVLPRSLAPFESMARARVHARIARGRVSGDVRLEYRGALLAETVGVNTALASRYVKALRNAARRLGLRDTLDTGLLLQLPDVVSQRQPETSAEHLEKALRSALDRALDALDRMRRTEAVALGRDLRASLRNMERPVQEILRPLVPQIVDQYRQHLLLKLEEAQLPADEQDHRLLKEIALFAVRADITEEVTRLLSHIRQARRFLRSAEPCGRQLDFIAQEMFREINTIGAKVHHIKVQRAVVAVKAEIERWREQAQNIE